MNCNKCNRTIPDGTTFCGYCGARVDGKNTCPKCGSLNDEQFEFCTTCGARIDGKIKCICGEYVDSSFNHCNHCGAELHQVSQKQDSPKLTSSRKFKLLDLISGIVMMAGVFVAFVFVFLLGYKSSLSGVELNQSIYYYFGEFYQKLASIDSSLYTSWTERYLYQQNLIVGVFTTVVGALTMLSVIAFTVPAVIVYILNVTGRSQKKADRWAYAAMVSFVAGALSLGALQYIKATINGLTMLVSLNGATVAGLIILGVMLVGMTVLRLIGNAKLAFAKERLAHTVASIFGIVLTAVFLGLAAVAGPNSVHKGHASPEMSHGFMGLNVYMGSRFSGSLDPEVLGDSQYIFATGELAGLRIFCLIGFVLTMLSTVFAMCAVISQIRGLEKGRSRSLVFGILSAVCAVAMLVFGVLVAFKVDSLVRNTGTYANVHQYAILITCVVFALLTLAATIVQRVKQSRTDEPSDAIAV